MPKCLNWGPDSVALTTNCCGVACWLGAARLDALRPSNLPTVSDAAKREDQDERKTKTWFLVLAYDGTDFAGWQRQAEGVRTLQGELEKALALIFRFPVKTLGASRTDAGVHAHGQVCHFESPEYWDSDASDDVLLKRLRLTLPAALLARRIGRAPEGFHARLSSCRKTYSYRLSTSLELFPFEARRCWACGALNLAKLQEGLRTLDGRPLDWTAFSMGDYEPEYHGPVVKTVQLLLKVEAPDRLVLYATGERFLYKMVRRIVGALVEVGKGRLCPEGLVEADRREIPTAPPQGLTLEEVLYPEEIQTLLTADTGGRQKDKTDERAALARTRRLLLGDEPEEDKEEEGPGAVYRGARGVIGEGDRQRQYRLDTDEPETAEALSKLARDVRQADLSAKTRSMAFQSKFLTHDLDMADLFKERLRLPLDITDLPLEEERSSELRRFRIKKKRAHDNDQLSFVSPGQRRQHLKEIERAVLKTSDEEAVRSARFRDRAPRRCIVAALPGASMLLEDLQMGLGAAASNRNSTSTWSSSNS
ncbi:unnamed protein product [Durusdinium trenchii]|uniref:Pseudouridine synthase I TruA alpha/beta domain-containing protein n=1 Tax=Durusdinium trenchii TaxID=1381693 RepID=A0ABP0P0E4_9DINO